MSLVVGSADRQAVLGTRSSRMEQNRLSWVRLISLTILYIFSIKMTFLKVNLGTQILTKEKKVCVFFLFFFFNLRVNAV